MAAPAITNLLERSLESRSESLRETWPLPLDTSLTGQDGIEWTVAEKSAIDIALLIVRAINAHCDPLDPDLPIFGRTLEQRRNIEEQVCLLHHSWYNNPGGRMTEEVLQLQKELCQKVLSGKSKMTFERLTEFGAMIKAFWARWEFSAWCMNENIQEEGAADWVKQRIASIPTMYGQSEVNVSDSDLAILEQLAYRSLLKWKWDGETKLADFLTSQSKLEWTSAGGKVHHRVDRAWPHCLRVRFDPRGRDDAPRFADLARIALYEPKVQETIHYRLLATVKLGGPGRQDYVRVYDKDCRDARPTATQAMSLPFVDNEWELGQPDSKYMLYYMNYEPEKFPDLPPKEVILYSWMEVEHLVQLKALRESLEDGRPEPLPYGRITIPEQPDVNEGQDVRQHGDVRDENGGASASADLNEDSRATPTGLDTRSEDPRAKTRQRVLDSGGDVAAHFGWK